MNRLMVQRFQRIGGLLNAYREECNISAPIEANTDFSTMIVGDFLTDLMHFCHLGNLDFAHILICSTGDFAAETDDGDDLEQEARRHAEATA